MFRRLAFNIGRSVRNVPRISSQICICNHVRMTIMQNIRTSKTRSDGRIRNTVLGFSLFTWLGLETKNTEDDIIYHIKKSILLIRKKEYRKAEQILHIALKLAQQTQNELAITYIYDILANLALEENQLDKAKKLFVSVSQRLFAKNVSEDDIKNVHISLKLARICHLKGELYNADVGFNWCLERLRKINSRPEVTDDDKLILAVGLDWYGHFLLDKNLYMESLPFLLESYEILKDFKENVEQIVILLNDIGTVYGMTEENHKSEEFLTKAIEISKSNQDVIDLGAVYINLGRIYLRQKLIEKARKSCGYGLRLCHDRGSTCVEEAKQCLKEINNFWL